MAKSGDVLEHPVTGEKVIWRKVAGETQGQLLQGDLFAKPGGHVAAAHVHPNQEERFEVLSGSLKLRIDDEERVLSPGDVAVIPPGHSHVWWNAGEDDLHVLGEFRPALRTEVFFETFFGLAADGKTNRKGLPNPLHLAVLMREFGDELHLASPPLGVQTAMFIPLAALGRLLGYRGRYPKYSHDPLAG